MNGASALHAGREIGFLASGLGRAVIRMPFVFAVIAWVAYVAFAAIAANMAADLHPVRVTRASCSWPRCELGQGDPIMTTEYDLTRPHAAMTTAAARSLQAATVFTVGSITVIGCSLFGGAARARRERRHHLSRAVGHVRRENARARADVENARARLGKVGEWRQKQWGKRWSAQAAAGEVYTNPKLVDRWLMRQGPKPKEQRKADRAAKRISKASARKEQAEMQVLWAAEEARLTTPDAKSRKEAARIATAMRVDAGGPKDQVEAWRQVIADPHENGPLPPSPPKNRHVSTPQVVTAKGAADRLAKVATGGEAP
jgi:hypothetical protein